MTAKSQAARSHPLNHVDDYLSIGQESGASDIHLGVNAPPLWRLHGLLQPIWPDAPPLTSENPLALAESFLSNLHKTQLNDRGDADFAYANDFGRYRTSVVRQRLGVDLVFRIINTKVRTMDELGLPEHLKLLTRYQNGLILVTGSASARDVGQFVARCPRAIAFEKSGWLGSSRGERNPGRERGVRDHPRRRHPKTSGRDR